MYFLYKSGYLRSYVHHPDNLKNYKNPLYEANTSVIWPSLFYQSISFWSGLFLRYQMDNEPFKEAKALIAKLVEEDTQARKKVDKLKA